MIQVMAVCFFCLHFFMSIIYAREGRKWVSHDFFIDRVEEKDNFPRPLAKGCRRGIAEKMCLVDPVAQGREGEDRPCLEGGKSYARHFELLYDAYPRSLQRMFCSIDKIFIENQFVGTAYAGIEKNSQGVILGAKIGIRRSVLDEGLDLKRWASWKEQLSFGGLQEGYQVVIDLPTVVAQSNLEANDFLFFVIAHEFGHLFDFANELNALKDPSCWEKEEAKECELAKNTWGQISWLTDRTPKNYNDFENRRGLCFYWCEGNWLAKKAISPLYEALNHTEFISTYATTQPWDDFADSLAYYVLHAYGNAKYSIHTQQGRTYDTSEKLHSKRFEGKLGFIQKFLNSTDINYP